MSETNNQKVIRVLADMASKDSRIADKLFSDAKSVYFFGEEKDFIADVARRFRRDYGAETEKDFSGENFVINVTLKLDGDGDGDSDDDTVCIRLVTYREAVCTPYVVGREEVEVKDYSMAPMKTVERDVVEWDCGSLLYD